MAIASLADIQTNIYVLTITYSEVVKLSRKIAKTVLSFYKL